MLNYPEIINQMSVFEKAQMMTGKTTWESKDFEKYGIPSLFLSDGPHGIRKQLGAADHLGLNESINSTCFPTAATIANSWDLELSHSIGEALAVEARELGVNVILGPGMNIKRNPLCGRNFEYFSEDPYLTGSIASEYVKGIQSKGIAATPKHFAVNSQELRRMSNDSIVDERTLREIYLSAFEQVVKEAKPDFMMTSYNQLNGVYTNEHPHLLQDILYREWQYEGVIVTDWGGSNDHVEGVKMGSHLEMPSTGLPGALEIEEAVHTGKLDLAILDQRVDELLTKVFKLAKTQLENRESLNEETVLNHHNLAYQASQESIVLLKNNNGILPLNAQQSVGFIGDFVKKPRYQGAGSSVVNPTTIETIDEVKADYGFAKAPFAQGYHRLGNLDEALIKEAVELAKSVEIPIVFMGLTEITESEGMDRTHMRLGADQLALIDAVSKVNPQVVVVLSGGSVVELPFSDKVAAVVHGYLTGQAGSRAMMDVLTGVINPSGKLAETYPYTYEEVGNAKFYPGLEKTSEYREGLFVGYRYFDKVEQEVRYPFGFGLSYTKFEYQDLTIVDQLVEVTIKNVGQVAGNEIVQAYVQHESKERIYVKQSLAGFKKVHLEPNESKRIQIALNPRAFEYFNTRTNQWECDGGEFTVAIASHSRDVRLSQVIEKDATTDQVAENLTLLPHYASGDISKVSAEEFELLLERKLPEAHWDKNAALSENDTISQLFYAKSPVARLVYKILNYFLEKSIRNGNPNLNLYFNYNMTFRAIQKMMGGMVNHEMVDHILLIVNGHFFKGTGRLIKAFFANKKLNRERVVE